MVRDRLANRAEDFPLSGISISGRSCEQVNAHFGKTEFQSEPCSTPSDLPPASPLRGLPLHPHRCVYLVLVLQQIHDTSASFALKIAVP